MNAEEYLDKIIIEFDYNNQSQYGITPIILKYLGHNPVITNQTDNKLVYEIASLIKQFDYAVPTDQTSLWYNIKDSWKEAKGHGGHYKYQAYLEEERNQNRIYKESDRKLKWYETENAKQIFDNYPKVDFRSKWALRVSIAAIILTILLQIIQWKCKG